MYQVGIAWDRTFLMDGRLLIGPALHVSDVSSEQLDELIRMTAHLKLDAESKQQLTFSREELQTSVDWFISLDERYAVLRHISYGEWKDFAFDQRGLSIDPDLDESTIKDILQYYRREIARRPHLQIRAKEGTKVLEKYIRRINLSKSRQQSVTDILWEVERNAAYLPEAKVDGLVLSYLINNRIDEHARNLVKQIEKRLKRILKNSRELERQHERLFGELIDLQGLTLRELKRRRDRGQKLLAKFLLEFSVDYEKPGMFSQLFPAPRAGFDQGVEEFCNQLPDDELLEFICAYVGYVNREWDVRSKIIAISVESRLRRNYDS